MSPQTVPRRPDILGFGPIGCALLVPLAALIWVAVTGYDLQYQLLRLVDALFGWEGLYYFVPRIFAGHFFSLHMPTFGLIALCVVLIPLHFAPRRPSGWIYAGLVAWALIAPALPGILLGLRPAGFNLIAWRLLLETPGALGAAALTRMVGRPDLGLYRITAPAP